ncbi:hypothetical protein TRIUR3_27587 [Triticum urartu]|uniref:Uncharacterized protein n=1 Tax=Triticum urartu TaxID=4572 RepID=M8ATU9_TRIUA|nr:hypothetical protein TRIUR3_27587 [Triticum urartu]
MVVVERGRGCPRLEQRRSTSGGAGCLYAGRRSEAEQQRRGEPGHGDGETMQRRVGGAGSGRRRVRGVRLRKHQAEEEKGRHAWGLQRGGGTMERKAWGVGEMEMARLRGGPSAALWIEEEGR